MRLQLIVAVALTGRALAQPGITNELPEPPTGTARLGAYADTDQTQVYRLLAAVARVWGSWQLRASLTIDAVSSASTDVKSSPLLRPDGVTGASTATGVVEMSDRRYQVTTGADWKDSDGHAATVTIAIARESDYTSASAGVNGSYDVAGRTTTLLGGATVTANQITSVTDSTFRESMTAIGWTAGVAQVLTPDDAIRLRYDGKLSTGYQASPYRRVRFGDWTPLFQEAHIDFLGTIGSPDGLPEKVPDLRASHAVIAEWVHSLAPGIGLHPEIRVGTDTWSVDSIAASLDLRIARPSWRLLVGYRFYAQSHAWFFEDKYVAAPEMYADYTSNKELGDMRGHHARLEVAEVVREATGPGMNRLLLGIEIDAAHYRYPGFPLLASRDSAFVLAGFTWEH